MRTLSAGPPAARTIGIIERLHHRWPRVAERTKMGLTFRRAPHHVRRSGRSCDRPRRRSCTRCLPWWTWSTGSRRHAPTPPGRRSSLPRSSSWLPGWSVRRCAASSWPGRALFSPRRSVMTWRGCAAEPWWPSSSRDRRTRLTRYRMPWTRWPKPEVRAMPWPWPRRTTPWRCASTWSTAYPRRWITCTTR